MTIELLNEIFSVCIVPLLAILTKYLISYLNSMKINTDNNVADKYLDMLRNTIITCVQATNQTYVDSLKKQNAFDAEAQKNAFEMTYNAIMLIVTDESKKYLSLVVGDVEEYIRQQIEGTIKESKIMEIK